MSQPNCQRAESTGPDSNRRIRITGAESLPLNDQCLFVSGIGGDRTHIILFKRQALHQLSYKAVQCVGQELNLHSNAGGLQPLGLANAQPTQE